MNALRIIAFLPMCGGALAQSFDDGLYELSVLETNQLIVAEDGA